MNAERCDHLIHAHLDGSLSDAERAEFENLLLASESARQRFWELAEVHGLTGEAARIAWGEPEEVESTPENGSMEAGGRGDWRWARSLVSLAAAAVVLFAAIHYFVRPATEKPTSTTVASDVVATLLLAEDCDWRGDRHLIEGQSLSVGQTLRLARGTAVLRFESGAELVLNTDTDLELESRGSVRLLGGRLTVRAPEEAAGFCGAHASKRCDRPGHGIRRVGRKQRSDGGACARRAGIARQTGRATRSRSGAGCREGRSLRPRRRAHGKHGAAGGVTFFGTARCGHGEAAPRLADGFRGV